MVKIPGEGPDLNEWSEYETYVPAKIVPPVGSEGLSIVATRHYLSPTDRRLDIGFRATTPQTIPAHVPERAVEYYSAYPLVRDLHPLIRVRSVLNDGSAGSEKCVNANSRAGSLVAISGQGRTLHARLRTVNTTRAAREVVKVGVERLLGTVGVQVVTEVRKDLPIDASSEQRRTYPGQISVAVPHGSVDITAPCFNPKRPVVTFPNVDPFHVAAAALHVVGAVVYDALWNGFPAPNPNTVTVGTPPPDPNIAWQKRWE